VIYNKTVENLINARQRFRSAVLSKRYRRIGIIAKKLLQLFTVVNVWL